MPRTKKQIQGYCDKCSKKLLVPSWKYCADCDFNSYTKAYFRRQLRMYQARLRAERKSYKNSKYRNATIIVIDENGVAIGYK